MNRDNTYAQLYYSKTKTISKFLTECYYQFAGIDIFNHMNKTFITNIHFSQKYFDILLLIKFVYILPLIKTLRFCFL